MTSTDANYVRSPSSYREPSLLAQSALVVFPAVVVLAIPIIWHTCRGDELRPDIVAPWVSAAVSLAAVLWAISRAHVEGLRRCNDLRLAEERRRADQVTYQERLDEEREHARALSAATAVSIVRQGVVDDSDVTKFFVDVEILNAGQQPILEVSIDALWSTRAPVATLENYVLHPADASEVGDARQIQVLQPGESLTTKSLTMAEGSGRKKPPAGWFFSSPVKLTGFSINPVGDLVAVFSFLDNTGYRWQRIGSELPTPLPNEHPPPPLVPSDVVSLWPAGNTLTVESTSRCDV